MIGKAPIPANEPRAEKIDKVQQQISEIDNVIRKGMNTGKVPNIDKENKQTNLDPEQEKETKEIKQQINDIKQRK